MNNCCGSLALYWQNVVLRAVRGAGKDNPLAEIVAFTRLWRAFPRTSLQMSCCFLFPDCEVGFYGRKWGNSAPGDGRKDWGTSKALWAAAALDTSPSSRCQVDKITSPFLQILCYQSWRGQPVSPAPSEPTWQSQGSTTRILPPLYFQFSLLFQLSPSEALHSWQVSVKENPPVLSLSHKLFIFNPLWGAVPRLQAHRLLIYLQLKLSESGC